MTDMDGTTNNLDANQGAGQPHSADGTEADLLSTLNAINQRLAQLEGQQRALQSGKDRGIAGLQDEVHKMQSNFAEILDYGKRYGDPAEAERNWRIDQFLSKAIGNDPVGQDQQFQAGLANQQPNTADVDASVLQQYGVDPQSPEYLAQIRQGKSSFEAALAVASGKAQSMGQQGEGFASGASGGAGSASPASGTERQQASLLAQYKAEVDDAVKAGGGYLSPRQLYFIQEKFVEQGLDRSAIGW